MSVLDRWVNELLTVYPGCTRGFAAINGFVSSSFFKDFGHGSGTSPFVYVAMFKN
jgi:hypothetical protein